MNGIQRNKAIAPKVEEGEAYTRTKIHPFSEPLK
jgi:hypothetical protein